MLNKYAVAVVPRFVLSIALPFKPLPCFGLDQDLPWMFLQYLTFNV